MRRHACLLLAVIVFTSCGASRRAAKMQTATDIEQTAAGRTERTDTASRGRITATDIRQDEVLQTKIVEFDTALPPDPATGRPPVKRITTHSRRAAAQTRRTSATVEQEASRQQAETAAAVRSTASTVAEERSRRGLNGLQQVLCYTGAAAMLGLLLWLTVRRFKRL